MGESDEVRNHENSDCNGVLSVENANDSKSWKTISSITDIQKQSRNWTLAGDAGLLEYLQGFSHQLISKTHEIEKNVDQLIHEAKVTSSRVNNIINDFLMLSNTQFIENRVYDEEVQTDSSVSANKQEEQKTKEQREAEIIPQISAALALGLEVIDKAFDQVEIQGDSDSEDEEGRAIHGESLLEPKDPYLHRPLPHVIGSESFYNDDNVGLFDLVYNDTESVSESDQKEYDSGGDSSEESFEEPMTKEKESEPVQQETFHDGLPKFEASYDSDSSDMFGDEAEYISGRSDSEEYMKEEKPNDAKTYPVINKEPENDVSKHLFNDIFSFNKNEEKSTFLPSSSSKNSLFDDDNDFEDSPPQIKERLNTGKSIEIITESSNVPEKKTNDLKGKQVMIAKDLEALFQSGDSDVFPPKKVLEKTKAKDMKAERTKSVSLFDEDDDDGKLFAESITKSSVKPASSSDMLIEQNEYEEPPIVTKSMFPSHDIKSSFDSKSSEIADLFTDNSQDDLFDVLDKTEKIHSSDLASKYPLKLPEATTAQQKIIEEKNISKEKASMFSLLDDDEDDLFSLPKKENNGKISLSIQTKSRSGSSLFEDDDLFKKDTSDSPDVDLFATKSNVSAKKEILKTQSRLPEVTADLNKQQPKIPVGGVSLFGNIDILGKGKSTPDKSMKTDLLENMNEPVPLPKVEDSPSVKSTEQVSVSFDHPVDTSNTLNCAAKGRAKIQTRRRPPSRKGRQSGLASAVEKSEPVDQIDNIFDDTQVPESTSMSTQHKEMNIDILTSPSTEEDDIFPMCDPTRDIFSTVESKKDMSFTDSLFSNIEEKKSSNITDDIFDDIFSAPITNSTRAPVLSTSPDDIFSEEPTAKESSIFSSISFSKQQHNKQGDIFSESDDDIFSSQAAVKPATTVTKKPTSIKQVKRESDIFDDPLLGFSNSNKD